MRSVVSAIGRSSIATIIADAAGDMLQQVPSEARALARSACCIASSADAPTYWCGRPLCSAMHAGERGLCQAIHGGSLDAAIGDVVIATMTPLAIEVALTVQQELVTRSDEADHLRRQHVERARYEADLAERRFLNVDPDHRLVADALEADWNAKLRTLTVAQETYAQAKTIDDHVVTDAERAALLALATDFPRLWRDATTSMKEKKRMVRLLITDVTLTKGDVLHADIRFAGGATRSLDIPLPKTCAELRTTDAEVIREIDQLIDTYTDAEIADVLKERGVRTVVPTPWTGPRKPSAPFARCRGRPPCHELARTAPRAP